MHLVEVDDVDARAGRSEASSARVRCRSDSPAPLGTSSIGKRPLVASTTGSVTSAGRAANQRPMICSETPAAVDVGGVDERAARLDEPVELFVGDRFVGLEPKVIVPRQRLETAHPLAPSGAVIHDFEPTPSEVSTRLQLSPADAGHGRPERQPRGAAGDQPFAIRCNCW